MNGQGSKFGNNENIGAMGNGGTVGYQFPTRFSKVEFPRFNGDDVNGWFYRCELFFEVNGTPEEEKVRMATIHLKGKALQWHQSFKKTRIRDLNISWELSSQVVTVRFGAMVYEDPLLAIMNLKKQGTL